MTSEMQTGLLFIYTESALHAGTGSGLSAIDLPIQRERTTDYPNIQGSGIKGALRSQGMDKGETNKNEVEAIFGPSDTKNGSDYAGAISVGEARIILFPVRSLAGVFAYVTCPHVLARLQRELQSSGYDWVVPDFGKSEGEKGISLVTTNADVIANQYVILEEFSFRAEADQGVNNIADWLAENAFPQGNEYEFWRNKIKTSLVILPDDVFRDFVKNSTEVVTRIKIQPDSKTVATGALWTQEALPADTLMMSAITARRLRLAKNQYPTGLANGTSQEILGWLGENIPSRIQIGGDETTGLGQVALRWL